MIVAGGQAPPPIQRPAATPTPRRTGPSSDDLARATFVFEESEVFYDSAITDLTFGDREIDYDSKEQCQAILEEFTMHLLQATPSQALPTSEGDEEKLKEIPGKLQDKVAWVCEHLRSLEQCTSPEERTGRLRKRSAS